jgi:hypothetical protein
VCAAHLIAVPVRHPRIAEVHDPRAPLGSLRPLCSLRLRELSAGHTLLWEQNGYCLLISAYLRGQAAHEMNDYFSAIVGELHV